jgi:hypothetical protein
VGDLRAQLYVHAKLRFSVVQMGLGSLRACKRGTPW